MSTKFDSNKHSMSLEIQIAGSDDKTQPPTHSLIVFDCEIVVTSKYHDLPLIQKSQQIAIAKNAQSDWFDSVMTIDQIDKDRYCCPEVISKTVKMKLIITNPADKVLSKTAEQITAADTPNQFSGQIIGMLDVALFKDLKIACHNEYLFECNKFVVARESKVILKALSNPNSKESQTGTFNFVLACATPQNTRLLIDCMYEGWSDKMNDHVHELLQLAHWYECEKIAAMASPFLKRNLTMETFWKISGDAVCLADTEKASLIQTCAQFANAEPGRWTKLMNMSDIGTDATIATLMKAIAKLNMK